MTTFLLIRHAAHDLLDRRLASRMPGVSLSAAGKEQAERLAMRLSSAGRIDALYSSPLERALETAEPIARRLGLQVQVAQGLVEVDFGDWTGRDIVELRADPAWKQFNAFRSGMRPPNGEMTLEVQARAVAELDRIRQDYPGGIAAVVSHSDVIRCIVLHYMGGPIDFLLRLEVSPASVSALRVEDRGARLLSFNDTGDLHAGS